MAKTPEHSENEPDGDQVGDRGNDDVDGSRASDAESVPRLLGRLSAEKVNAASVRNLVAVLRRSLRVNKKGIGLSGQGLSDLLLRTAPLIPVRDRPTLEAQYGGMTGTALAGQVIRTSARNSAAVGGVTGAVASMSELAPPLWLMLPVEVIAETLIIASIEMKMVAELHEVYGVPLVGPPEERGLAIVESWSMRKGIDLDELRSQRSVDAVMRKKAGGQIMAAIRRRLLIRAGRNISSLAPLMIGAVAGAELNRRATRDLGDAVVRDLSVGK